MTRKSDRLKQLLSLAACVLMILAVSIRRDGKWLGHKVETVSDSIKGDKVQTIQELADGTTLINTSLVGKDIIGYAGTVPLEIRIKDDRIADIKALDNEETPEFFERAKSLLNQWNGKTLQQAQTLKVDAVSGATFSSKAIIGNVKVGIQTALKKEEKESLLARIDLSPKALSGLVVALMAALLPLFVKNKRYRLVQQVFNILVLGVWCGLFLNYSSLIGYLSNGLDILSLAVPTIMLITAFVYPLLGKKSHYCTHVCPFGSLQELSGKCVKYKIKIGTQTVKRLDTFRQVLWAALMFCLWTGVWSDWIDYEPFSAFIFASASWIVLAIAATFVLLSLVVTRPYCRFVCPTGTLFKLSQSSK